MRLLVHAYRRRACAIPAFPGPVGNAGPKWPVRDSGGTQVAREKNQEVWSCLSVRQPYAWAIIVGAKDVENRNRACYYTGELFIHASRTEDADYVEEVAERVALHLGISAEQALAQYQRHLQHGRSAIIGSVQMFGCAISYDSEWFEGPPHRRPSLRKRLYGYLLRDAEQFEHPIPAKGSTAIPFKFRRR